MDSSHFQNIQEAYNLIYSNTDPEVIEEEGGRRGSGSNPSQTNQSVSGKQVVSGVKNAFGSAWNSTPVGMIGREAQKASAVPRSSGPRNLRGGGRRTSSSAPAKPTGTATGGRGTGGAGSSAFTGGSYSRPNKNTGGSDRPGDLAPAPRPTDRPGGSAPAPRPTGGSQRPTQAAKPAPARVAQTGDKGKDTQTWAKANPTLANRSKTPNPLMQKTFGYQTGNAPDQRAKAAAKPAPSPRAMAAQSSVRTGTTGAPTASSGYASKVRSVSIAPKATTAPKRTTQLSHNDLLSTSNGGYIEEGQRPYPLKRVLAKANKIGGELSSTKKKKQKRELQRRLEALGRTAGRMDVERTSIIASVDPDLAYDYIIDYLVNEGYANSFEDADVIMENMSDQWIYGILDESVRGSERHWTKKLMGNDIRKVSRGSADVYKKPKWEDDVETKVARGSQLRKKGEDEYDNDKKDRARQVSNSRAIKRLNAKPNIGTSDEDGQHHIGPEEKKSYYKEVPTDYHARKRRASGR